MSMVQALADVNLGGNAQREELTDFNCRPSLPYLFHRIFHDTRKSLLQEHSGILRIFSSHCPEDYITRTTIQRSHDTEHRLRQNLKWYYSD